MREAGGCERLAVLGLAVLLHFGAGLVGVVAYLVRTDDDLFAAAAEPHPLDSWVRPAVVAWFVVFAVLLLLTDWSSPHRRFAAQLLLPVVGLAAWLAIVGLVDSHYPATLRADLGAGASTTTEADLAPGPQSLAIRNATGTRQAVGLVRSDRPLGDADLAAGRIGRWGTGQAVAGVGWVAIDLPICAIDNSSCSGPALALSPGEEARRVVKLERGYYAFVCARITITYPGQTLEPNGGCRPVRFTVGMGTTTERRVQTAG